LTEVIGGGFSADTKEVTVPDSGTDVAFVSWVVLETVTIAVDYLHNAG